MIPRSNPNWPWRAQVTAPRAGQRGKPPDPVKAGLRDTKVLALVAKGLDHVEIAAALECRSAAVRVRLRALRAMGLV